MLDTTLIAAAPLPYQVAGIAHDPSLAPSGCRHAHQHTWHVAATKPRAERIAHAALHLRGYKPYLPLTLGKPLFSGYVFLQLGPGQPWYPIQWAPGVWHLLQTHGKPHIVAGADIRAVQTAEALAASTTQDEAQWAPGMPCRPRKGHAMEGMDAVILSLSSKHAVIAIMMLGHLRQASIHISHLQHRNE